LSVDFTLACKVNAYASSTL